MKKTKKLTSAIAIFLAVLMVFTMTSCGSSGSASSANEPAAASAAAPAYTGTAAADAAPADAAPAGTASAGGQDSNTFVWQIDMADMLSMDPALMVYGTYYLNLFEGLTREEADGSIVPCAAESWDVSDDGTVYTFHIRDGATWTNGDPVTANDFEYAWKRVLDPETASPNAWLFAFSNIAGAIEYMFMGGSADDLGFKALDEKTFEVTLIAPTDWFTALIGHWIFMPVNQKAVESGDDWSIDPAKFIGNGPYKLDEHILQKSVTMTKRDDYWNKDDIGVETVICRFIEDPNTAFTAYQQGETDLSDNVPDSELNALRMDPDSGLEFLAMPQVQFLDFNLDVEPLNDIRVRQALTLAIDREALCSALGFGFSPAINAIPDCLYDTEGNVFCEKATESQTFQVPTDGSRIEEAQKLLAEAGYPNGEGFPKLTVLHSNEAVMVTSCQVIQEMWKQNLGIDVELNNVEFQMFLDQRANHDFDISWMSWFIDYADASSTLSVFTSSSDNNYSNYHDDKYDELVDQAMVTVGKEHFDAMYEANAILMDAVTYAPLVSAVRSVLIRPNLKGWIWQTVGSYDFSHIRWEE